MVTLGNPGAPSLLCSNQNVKVQLQKACYVSFIRGFIRADVHTRNGLRYYSLFQTSVYADLRLKTYNFNYDLIMHIFDYGRVISFIQDEYNCESSIDFGYKCYFL